MNPGIVTRPSFRQPGNCIVNSCEGTNLRSLIAVLTLGLLAAFSSTTVLADEGEINVIEAKAESRFPDGIRFSVTAESPGLIDEIRVLFKKVDQSDRSAYRSFEFEPGQSVTGESLLPASGGNDYFPPGTRSSSLLKCVIRQVVLSGPKASSLSTKITALSG